jgi:hypothetical protein
MVFALRIGKSSVRAYAGRKGIIMRRALWIAAGAIVLGATLLLAAGVLTAGELPPGVLQDWANYVKATEQRIAAELRAGKGFLALDFQPGAEVASERRALLAGEIPIKKMISYDPSGEKMVLSGGIAHHWRGSVFIPGAKLEEIISRVLNPTAADMQQEDVLQWRVLERGHDSLKIFLKLQRSKFVTVVYNTEHEVRVQRYGKDRASSTSVATRIAELEAPNSSREREKPEGQDHGFLWRMNSYWRYEQVSGGVIVECESVTLSRSVPFLLEPLIHSLIESTARESLERTLASMRKRHAK